MHQTQTEHYFDLNNRPVTIGPRRSRWPLWERFVAVATVCLVAGACSMLSVAKFQNWWQDRAEQRSQIGGHVMPPVNSVLNTAIVDWTMKNGAKNRQFAEFVVRQTFESSAQRDVDPWLMLALISVESRFDPFARSGAGAMGLTQIIPYWHQEKISLAHAYDPRINIDTGTEILREYTAKQKGNTVRALLQYNGSLQQPGPYAIKVMAARTALMAYALARVMENA